MFGQIPGGRSAPEQKSEQKINAVLNNHLYPLIKFCKVENDFKNSIQQDEFGNEHFIYIGGKTRWAGPGPNLMNVHAEHAVHSKHLVKDNDANQVYYRCQALLVAIRELRELSYTEMVAFESNKINITQSKTNAPGGPVRISTNNVAADNSRCTLQALLEILADHHSYNREHEVTRNRATRPIHYIYDCVRFECELAQGKTITTKLLKEFKSPDMYLYLAEELQKPDVSNDFVREVRHTVCSQNIEKVMKAIGDIQPNDPQPLTPDQQRSLVNFVVDLNRHLSSSKRGKFYKYIQEHTDNPIFKQVDARLRLLSLDVIVREIKAQAALSRQQNTEEKAVFEPDVRLLQALNSKLNTMLGSDDGSTFYIDVINALPPEQAKRHYASIKTAAKYLDDATLKAKCEEFLEQGRDALQQQAVGQDEKSNPDYEPPAYQV